MRTSFKPSSLTSSGLLGQWRSNDVLGRWLRTSQFGKVQFGCHVKTCTDSNTFLVGTLCPSMTAGFRKQNACMKEIISYVRYQILWKKELESTKMTTGM